MTEPDQEPMREPRTLLPQGLSRITEIKKVQQISVFPLDQLNLYLLTDPMRVTMVRTVVTPSPTRAGAAPLLSQKETQDMTTMRLLGM